MEAVPNRLPEGGIRAQESSGVASKNEESSPRHLLSPYTPPAAPPTPIHRTISRDKSVLIYDWDDTLCPTSWLLCRGLDPWSPCGSETTEDKALLARLEQHVYDALEAALKGAVVYIITNANARWVGLTASRFLPRIFPLLARVSILSAREMFEGGHPDAPAEWKHLAFRAVFGRRFEGPGYRSILSVGDSVYERNALIHTTAGCSSTFTKSVTFLERPSVSLMCRQLSMLVSNLREIIAAQSNLDLMLGGSRPQAPKPVSKTTPTTTPIPTTTTPPTLPSPASTASSVSCSSSASSASSSSSSSSSSTVSTRCSSFSSTRSACSASSSAVVPGGSDVPSMPSIAKTTANPAPTTTPHATVAPKPPIEGHTTSMVSSTMPSSAPRPTRPVPVTPTGSGAACSAPSVGA